MTDLEIRQLIADYIAEKIIASELEDQLETLAWDLEEEPARSVAADALLLLAEHQNGDWSEAELRERLGAIGRTYWFYQAPKTVVSDSVSRLIRRGRRSVASDRRLVEGYV